MSNYRNFILTTVAVALLATSQSQTFADSCPTSATTITGAVTDTCELFNGGDSLTVEATGEIDTAFSFSNAVDVNTSSSPTPIVIDNAGSITGFSSAVVATGSSKISSLTNSGTILGGIELFDNSSITTLNNAESGTITSNRDGVALYRSTINELNKGLS